MKVVGNLSRADLPLLAVLHAAEEGAEGRELGFRFQQLSMAAGELKISQLSGLQVGSSVPTHHMSQPSCSPQLFIHQI